MYRHTQAYHCIFYHDSYQLKSIRIITGWGKAGSDGDQGRFEELDASSVSDVNHLEKQLICELKGTQLEAKTMRKIAVKFVIISLSCACPKYRNWSLSFAFQSDLTHFAGRWMFACRLAISLAKCRCCMPLDRGSTDLESQCCPTRDLSDTTGNSHTPVGDSEKHQGSAPPGSKAKGEFDKDGQASHRQGFSQPPGTKGAPLHNTILSWNQLLFAHISVGFLMHMYELLQLPASSSNYFINASNFVSCVIGIMHSTSPAIGVLGVLGATLPPDWTWITLMWSWLQ